MSVFCIWVSATLGVAICALFTSTTWEDVFERSFFMGTALFLVYLRDRHSLGKTEETR